MSFRRVRTLGFLVLASVALVACGGRVALYQNVPDGGGGQVGGAAGTGDVDPRTLDVNAVWPGAGCGKPLPATQVQTVVGSPKGYTRFTVMGTGANLTNTPIVAKAAPRTFWVRVPADYDANRPYRVVYLGGGCGTGDMANMSTYPLYRESFGGTEQAIYVALDIPADQANQGCYDNQSGPQSQEWEAFQLFQEFVDAHYCVDLNKIYVAGYSTGAWLANQWGCYFAGWPKTPRKFAPTYHIRAQAGLSGGEPDNQPPCGGPVAGFWIGDATDNAHPLSGSIAALARVGRMNGCDTSFADPSLQTDWHAADQRLGAGICKKFVGCPKDDPVVFCTTVGLAKTSQDERMIPALKYFFDEVESGAPPETPCVPACDRAGPTECGVGGGLKTCTLDAKGCPIVGPSIPCGPGWKCGGPPEALGCVRDPLCPVVPDNCQVPGSFCLDDHTVAMCTEGDLTPTGVPGCLSVTNARPCAAGGTCVGGPYGRCQ